MMKILCVKALTLRGADGLAVLHHLCLSLPLRQLPCLMLTVRYVALRMNILVAQIVRFIMCPIQPERLPLLTSVLGSGPSLGTRLHKIKACTINKNPHLDCLPAIHKQTDNLCRLT